MSLLNVLNIDLVNLRENVFVFVSRSGMMVKFESYMKYVHSVIYNMR